MDGKARRKGGLFCGGEEGGVEGLGGPVGAGWYWGDVEEMP